MGIDIVTRKTTGPLATLRNSQHGRDDIGCKRIIFSNDYYKALREDNVNLIASALNAIHNNKAIAKNGEYLVLWVYPKRLLP